jgi:glycosyltransferase involved in cell wall biosynthesis
VKETKLVICGRTPRAELVALAANRPNVDLIGDPEVLDTYYNNATAVLIPLSQGGGTRLKVLEAMARGVPVIATNKAVEGLNLVDGETFLRAETDKEFASAFAKILSDQNTARRLVLAGTAFVTQNHGPSEIATRVSTAVRHALKR